MSKSPTAKRVPPRTQAEFVADSTPPESAPLAVLERPSAALAAAWESQLDLVKDSCCKPKNRQATDAEFALFLHQCRTRRLDPLVRQIYAVFRWNSQLGREAMTIQTSIDGFRLIAQRTSEYRGQSGPFWCGEDGEWVDVWTSKTHPVAAKVGVWREGFKEPVYSVARFDSYAQWAKGENGAQFLTGQWGKMDDLMIAKCAEALALRRAFPDELSGLYTSDEMSQADAGEAEPAAASPPPHVRPAAALPSSNGTHSNGRAGSNGTANGQHAPAPIAAPIAPASPKAKLWQEIRAWSGVQKNDGAGLGDAARRVYAHLDIPANGKATDEQIATALDYVQILLVEGVDFAEWASGPKAIDQKHAKAVRGLVPITSAPALAVAAPAPASKPDLTYEPIAEEDIPF